MTYDDQQNWFRERVGKIIWRNYSCDCPSCKEIHRNGLLVDDQYHADYLCDLVSDYAAEGSVLKYFDTKEERDSFEKQLLMNRDIILGDKDLG